MIENDVGGGYGARGEFYPEDFLIPFAAMHVNRPVKWIEDRRENLMAMNHARETEADLEIACQRDGTIIALRGEVHTDMGAYMRTNGAVGARNAPQFVTGPYRVPHHKVNSHLWMTNKTPVGTYRGPGRFEGCFYMERLLDMVAADLNIDRIELRRRNLIGKAEHPYKLATAQPTNAHDQTNSGDYQATLDRCLKEFNYADVSKLGGKLIDGKYHGIGVSCFIEGGAAGPKESARLEVNDDDTITVYMGTASVGQGVETIYAQIAADALEVPIERIRHVYHGSTGIVSDGYGAYHSRSVVMGGSAVLDATEKFMALLRQAAGKRLGCAEAKVTLDVDRVMRRRYHPAAQGIRRSYRGGCVPQPQAHLQLRNPCCSHHGRCAARPYRNCRLCRGAGCWPRHQSAHGTGTSDRFAGAGTRGRGAGGS